MELATSIDHARGALGKGDVRAAIDHLLVVWCDLRAAPIADAIERLSTAALPPPLDTLDVSDAFERPRTIRRLREGTAAAATGILNPIRATDDPRVASALVDLLEDPPWHATSSRPFWRRLFEILDANPDPRSLSRMSKIRYDKIIKGKTMRGWMQKRVRDAIAHLEEHPACSGTPRIARADRDALATLAVDPKQLRRRTAKRSAEAELFAAVYESPDDDGPRLVLADFLLERGDPRGELISLQLSGTSTKATRDRALAIIRKHQKVWMGALAPHLKYFLYPSVAAIDPLGINMWWRRGFLAGCHARPTRPKLVTLADDPKWSTLERVTSLRYERKDGLDDALRRVFTRLRAVRVLDGSNAYAVEIAAQTPAAARLESVRYHTDLESLPTSLACLVTMPKLRAVDMRLHYRDEPTLMPVIASGLLASSSLERFEFRNLTLTRTDGGPWSVRIEEATDETTGLVGQLLGANLELAEPTFYKCRKPRREAIERLFAEA